MFLPKSGHRVPARGGHESSRVAAGVAANGDITEDLRVSILYATMSARWLESLLCTRRNIKKKT